MATDLKKLTKLSWRRLVISDQGIEGILVLKERCPRVSQTSEAHSIIFQAGKVEGYTQAIAEIYNLITPDAIPDQDLESK